ncbi:hypothetical protein [Thalassoglobus polymorphus]|nr:hypothetical protein [Thalassoglobus polymorphus]
MKPKNNILLQPLREKLEKLTYRSAEEVLKVDNDDRRSWAYIL